MNTERWQRVGDIFERLLEVPQVERDKRLESLCGADDELRVIVMSMLDSHEGVHFSDASVATLRETSRAAVASLASGKEVPRLGDVAGTRVGHWRLARRIGAGGMGVVWLAERADGQFEQRAALKLVKRGMDSDAVLARFRRERQILARLEHPHIAHLLDGGIAEDGRPYFAMEYVEGKPLLDYGRDNNLSLADRLKLFLQICGAVSFAHARHVVHRDIKPSNVLVAANGSVKLLDFGIAKMLQDDEELAATLTATHREQPMTPAYAAPEQFSGNEITEATDVYALGGLLYELLTGQRAHDFGGVKDMRDVLKIIQATDPVAPSRTNFNAAPVPQKRLRGDLDTIVLTALRHDPARRYPTVAAFASDIQSYLAGQPIAARRDHVFYRGYKFLRRHRGGVVAVGAVALIAIAAWIVVIGERRTRSFASTESSVAISDFSNLSGRKESAWIGAALAPMVGNELAQGSKLHALPDEEVRGATTDLVAPTSAGYARSELTTIRRRLGAEYVISGSYLVTGSDKDAKVRLDVAMQDTRDGTTVATVVHTASADNLLALIETVGTGLRDQLGFSRIDPETKRQVAQAQPPSTIVARHIGIALDALRRYEPARAQAELTEAVMAAPGYAPAYLYLAQAWKQMGYAQKAQAAAQQAAIRSANLPELQRLSIAREVATQKGEWKQAVELDKRLLALEPGNSERHIALVRDLRGQGQIDESDRAIAAWRTLPNSNGDARIGLEASENANHRGDQVSALRLAQEALLKAKTSDSIGFMGSANYLIARSLNSLGRKEGMQEPLTLAVAEFRQVENPSKEAEAYVLKGVILDRLNQVTEALAQFQAALEIYQRVGDQLGVATVYFNQQRILWRHGDLDAAILVAKKTLKIGEETGDLRTQALAASSLSSMHMDESVDDSVMQELRSAIDVGERSGFRPQVLFAQQNYIEALRLRGDLQQAHDVCIEVEKGVRLLSQPYYTMLIGLRCALVARDRGDVELATKGFEEVLTIAESQSDRSKAADAEMNLAQIAVARKDLAGAGQRLERAVSGYAGAESATGGANAQALLAYCRRLQGQDAASSAALIRARELRSSVTLRREVFVADMFLAEMKDGDSAISDLRILAENARRSDWVAYFLEARISTLRLLQRAQSPMAKSVKAEIESMARDKGFNWILARLGASIPPSTH
ncbi:MAG: protein kinase [Rudaea sp.]